jgi:hypothetical protein
LLQAAGIFVEDKKLRSFKNWKVDDAIAGVGRGSLFSG